MTDERLCTRLSYDDFLSFDGPTGVAVAPDDSKHSFFHHLGLSEATWRHREIYAQMKAEATMGMEELFRTRHCLEPFLIDDDSVQAPYKLSQITEQAFQRQVISIYETASRSTKGIYDIVSTGDTCNNWVIRWMLWRVIRQAETPHERAPSSDIESPYSMAETLTTCTTAIDYPSVMTDRTTPPFSSPVWLPVVSPFRTFGHDDYGLTERKVMKLDADMSDRKPILPTGGFWTHVLNTYDTMETLETS